jgi:hypothetical protein
MLCRRIDIAQHQNAGAIDDEERGDLRQHTFGQPLHRFEIEQGRRGVYDDFQPAPGVFHPLQLLIAAQSRGQCSEKLISGEFRLRLVIVDVEIDDHPALRRLSRLTRAKDDTNSLVLQLPADKPNEIEAGRVRFHDDIEQHDRDIGMIAQQFAPFFGGICREKRETAAIQGIIIQRETRALVHGGIIIDDRHLPWS